VKNANPVCRPCWLVLIIFASAVACTFTGCDRSTPATDIALKSVADFFEIRLGDKVVRMQIAVREEEMQRGLMERRDLGRNDGMLFVYDHPQRMSFWMRDTPTPLDIGFFNASATLEEIYQLHPFDETTVSSRSSTLSLALEMNQGWYRENGIKPGAQLDTKALAAALKARGFQPEKFGIGR
jgi:uncharacterized membrane protein (UPF0127 family)